MTKDIKSLSTSFCIAAMLLIGAVSASSAKAQQAQLTEEQIGTAIEKAFSAATDVMTEGPSKVDIAGQASLAIPKDRIYVPMPEAGEILSAMGNPPAKPTQGVIFPAVDNENWFIVVSYVGDGYVSDKEASSWDHEEMLQSIKDNSEEDNKDRLARGYPVLNIEGWAENPSYDKTRNQLVWSLGIRDGNAAPGDPQTINYRTLGLGRNGIIAMTMVTSSKDLPVDRLAAREILDGLIYKPGMAYADFNASTDKVAAYGLGALIGVGIAKKAGLWAILGAFLVKAGKGIAIAVIAILAGLFSRFRKKGKSDPSDTE